MNKFKALGFDADRVAFSGAGREKGDVKIERPGTRFGDEWWQAHFWYLEVKYRTTSEFDLVYKAMDSFLVDQEKDVLFLKKDMTYCYISYNPLLLEPFCNDMKATHSLHLDKGVFSIRGNPLDRLLKYKSKWLGTCDMLVLMAPHKDALYVRYENSKVGSNTGNEVQGELCKVS